MATDNILRTYDDANSRKEDVLGLVEILTAKENWFLANLGKTKAINTIHNTLYDTLRTTATAAVAESGDYTNLARTAPSRFTNIVENVAIPFRVSRTEQLVEQYTGQNELARQTQKALVEWGNAAEFDLVRSTLTSGVSGTTPKMSKLVELFFIGYNRVVINLKQFYEKMSKVWRKYKEQKSENLLGVLCPLSSNT